MLAWAWLGVGALAVAGLFAILLALSRLPGIERIALWPLGFFWNGLVIHVIFSLVVWLLAMFALLVSSATVEVSGGGMRARMLGPIGQALVALSFPALFVPAFLATSTAELTNYIPLIRHPAYDAGLVLLAAGILAPVVRLLLNLPGRWKTASATSFAMSAASLIYIAALLCFGIAGTQLYRADLFDKVREYQFWGGGHLLQFVYVTMMVTIWSRLARAAFGEAGAGDRILGACALILLATALAGPIFYLILQPFSAGLREAFRLLQFALAAPSLLFALWLVASRVRSRGTGATPWTQPAFVALATALACYAVGGAMGIVIDGSDTRTPAHYHAMVTAVSVSCMGLLLTWGLEALGRRAVSARLLSFLIATYGGGQIFASIGLFMAGGYGAQRKAPIGAARLVDQAAFGMHLHGIGALFAIIGGALFVVVAIRCLLRADPAVVARDRRVAA